MQRVLLLGLLLGCANAYTITVFGSSVANGHLSEVRCDLLIPGSDVRECTYQQKLRERMLLLGNDVVNRTIDGDIAAGLLARFDRDLLPTMPDIVFIGLSLGNEGLIGDPFGAFNAYQPGLEQLVSEMRARNFKVLIGGCYAHSQMNAAEYEVTQQMNLLVNGFDVPSTNFLGTIDDGFGHWIEDFRGDDLHPNGLGQLELYTSIVPSVFDALLLGRTKPVRQPGELFTTSVAGDFTGTFVPSDVPFHSFTVSFRFRTSERDGVLFTVTPADFATMPMIELQRGAIAYSASIPNVAITTPPLATNTSDLWHEVTLTHRWAQKQTVLYVDGFPVGTVLERITPLQFTIGGGAGEPPAIVDLQDLLLFRSALNPREVLALAGGQLLQSSLEVYSPLGSGSTLNLAQSLTSIV